MYREICELSGLETSLIGTPILIGPWRTVFSKVVFGWKKRGLGVRLYRTSLTLDKLTHRGLITTVYFITSLLAHLSKGIQVERLVTQLVSPQGNDIVAPASFVWICQQQVMSYTVLPHLTFEVRGIKSHVPFRSLLVIFLNRTHTNYQIKTQLLW